MSDLYATLKRIAEIPTASPFRSDFPLTQFEQEILAQRDEMHCLAVACLTQHEPRCSDETMRMINVLTPQITGKAFDPGWFLLRQRFDEVDRLRRAQPDVPSVELLATAIHEFKHKGMPGRLTLYYQRPNGNIEQVLVQEFAETLHAALTAPPAPEEPKPSGRDARCRCDEVYQTCEYCWETKCREPKP